MSFVSISKSHYGSLTCCLDGRSALVGTKSLIWTDKSQPVGRQGSTVFVLFYFNTSCIFRSHMLNENMQPAEHTHLLCLRFNDKKCCASERRVAVVGILLLWNGKKNSTVWYFDLIPVILPNRAWLNMKCNNEGTGSSENQGNELASSAELKELRYLYLLEILA